MPLTPEQQARLEMLKKGPCVSVEYVREYYGLSWPMSADAARDYAAWAEKKSHRKPCPDGTVSRIDLEGFLQQQKLLPRKWMAARLGMTEDSLRAVLGRLDQLLMRPSRYVVYDELIAESLTDDIIPNLPGLKYRVFGGHEVFCPRLHQELAQTLKIEIQPLFCRTSEELEDNPLRYAHDVDCLTCEPLSIRHQIWLDFNKPMNLRTERCSKLLYIQNREALQPYLAGKQEPTGLERYEQPTAVGRYG